MTDAWAAAWCTIPSTDIRRRLKARWSTSHATGDLNLVVGAGRRRPEAKSCCRRPRWAKTPAAVLSAGCGIPKATKSAFIQKNSDLIKRFDDMLAFLLARGEGAAGAELSSRRFALDIDGILQHVDQGRRQDDQGQIHVSDHGISLDVAEGPTRRSFWRSA